MPFTVIFGNQKLILKRQHSGSVHLNTCRYGWTPEELDLTPEASALDTKIFLLPLTQRHSASSNLLSLLGGVLFVPFAEETLL